MSPSAEFLQYRGDGTTRAGRRATSPPGEDSVYLASPDLVHAVNAALVLEQPLLVTGEAGTGKTALAASIAAELELGEVEVFAVRSDHHGRELLYEFDNLGRFYDAQVQDPRARDRSNYLHLGPLGRAFDAPTCQVVLVDEIDKAPRDFPNDVLHALDRMELDIPELNKKVPARHRPIVVITSNEESQLPDAFLRRCVFHFIEAPDRAQLARILDERLRGIQLVAGLGERILDRFLELRSVEGLLKKPAVSELLTWVRVLNGAGITEDQLTGRLGDLPYLGTLLKTRPDFGRLRPDQA